MGAPLCCTNSRLRHSAGNRPTSPSLDLTCHGSSGSMASGPNSATPVETVPAPIRQTMKTRRAMSVLLPPGRQVVVQEKRRAAPTSRVKNPHAHMQGRATLQGIVSRTHCALQPPYDVRRHSGLPMPALDFGNPTCLVGCESDTAAKDRRSSEGPMGQPNKGTSGSPPDAPGRSGSLPQSDKDGPTVIASPSRLRATPDPTSGPTSRQSRDAIHDEGRLTTLAVQGQTWGSLPQTIPNPIQRDRSGSQGTRG